MNRNIDDGDQGASKVLGKVRGVSPIRLMPVLEGKDFGYQLRSFLAMQI